MYLPLNSRVRIFFFLQFSFVYAFFFSIFVIVSVRVCSGRVKFLSSFFIFNFLDALNSSFFFSLPLFYAMCFPKFVVFTGSFLFRFRFFFSSVSLLFSCFLFVFRSFDSYFVLSLCFLFSSFTGHFL